MSAVGWWNPKAILVMTLILVFTDSIRPLLSPWSRVAWMLGRCLRIFFPSSVNSHRAQHEMRSVPIPPALVALLRAHLREYGISPDGRLFRTARGRPLQDSAYSAVWQAARTAAFTPTQQASPLARRPYDLRHAAVSLWLNSGVPATEVARRAGHSVAVLLKVYAHCIDGQTNTVNKRIADALGSKDDPGA
jgi:Phage integrase family